jgi:hypothetical protein
MHVSTSFSRASLVLFSYEYTSDSESGCAGRDPVNIFEPTSGRLGRDGKKNIDGGVKLVENGLGVRSKIEAQLATRIRSMRADQNDVNEKTKTNINLETVICL